MVSCISSRLSVRSHLTTCVTGLCVVFAAEKKRKISMIPPWCHAVSSTHVCYYFCLLCTVKQPSQGLAVFDLGLTAHRRSPRPDTTPPPSDVKLRPAGPLWLYRRRTADKTQGWVVPLLQICHWLPPPPQPTPGRGPGAPGGPQPLMQRAQGWVWQPSCFHSFSIPVWCSCSNCCQILPANNWLLLESDADQNVDRSRFPTIRRTPGSRKVLKSVQNSRVCIGTRVSHFYHSWNRRSVGQQVLSYSL